MDLTLLAGPNGAGKTTFSEFLVKNNYLPTFPLNTDSLISLVYLSMIPEDFLRYENEIERQVKNIFYRETEKAILDKSSFCYETNFSYPDQLEPIGLFDRNGYELNMVYICLPNIDSSILRVQNRVSKGGHNVNFDKIKYNFEEGLRNLDKSFMEFNSVKIFETDIETGKLFLSMILEKTSGIKSFYAVPECFNEKLTPNLLKLVNESIGN